MLLSNDSHDLMASQVNGAQWVSITGDFGGQYQCGGGAFFGESLSLTLVCSNPISAKGLQRFG